MERSERDYNATVKKLRLDNQILKSKLDHVVKSLGFKDNFLVEQDEEKPVKQKPKGKKKRKTSNNRK